MRKLILSLFLLICFSASSARAEQTTPASSSTPPSSPEPVVTVTSPPGTKAKKWALFPLEIPAYVLRGATWPLLATIRLMETKWLSDAKPLEPKKKRFFAFPILQAGGGEGFGFGFSFELYDLFNAGDLAADYTYFLDVDNRANLIFFGNPIELGGRPLQYEFIFRWRDRNEAEYFGIGSDTQRDSVGEYAYNQLTTGVGVHYEVLRNLQLSVPLQFMTVEANSASGGDLPPVQDLFPASELAAFDQRTSYFVTGLEIAHDTRDSQVYPLRGGYRAFRFTRFQDLSDGAFSYNQYDIDIQQYIPLWAPRYVLLLRNAWVFQQSTGNNTVPFNLLADLDHYSPLRGFVVGRFRDEASVLFNLEYRFPIWSYADVQADSEDKGYFIDGVVFFDNGRVFPGIENFSFDDWHFAGGGGISIQWDQRMIMRLQAGYGGEGPLVFFQFGTPL